MKPRFPAKPAQKPAIPDSPSAPSRRRRRPQFTIFGLMVLMFVVSVAFAPLYYMVRAAQGETGFSAVAVLMAVAAPMLVMTAISIGYSVNQYFHRRRR
jgi:hypothetical protein